MKKMSKTLSIILATTFFVTPMNSLIILAYEVGSVEIWDNGESDLISFWEAGVSYNAGALVIHNDRLFESRWWTINESPGIMQNGAWMEIDYTYVLNGESAELIAIWTESRVFHYGDRVFFNGKIYVAKWWTRNQNPETGSPWRFVSEAVEATWHEQDLNFIEISPEEHDLLVQIMEEYLHFEDGKLYFEQIPFYVYSKFGRGIVEDLVASVEVTNEMSSHGEIQINEDLTIIELQSEPLEVGIASRSGRNARELHWWGSRNYMNQATARRFATDMLAVRTIASGVVIVLGATGNGLAATLAGATATWFWLVGDRINLHNNPRGVIWDLHHTRTFATRSQ